MSIGTIGPCNSTSEASSATPAVLNVISISLLPKSQARSSQPSLEFVSSCLSTVNASNTEEEESPPSENLLGKEEEDASLAFDSEVEGRSNVSSTQPNLDTLPRDILVIIQSFLDPASNNALSQTSHSLRNAANPAFAFRLRLEREQRTTFRELRRYGEQFTSTLEFSLDVSESDNITDQDLESIVDRFPNITGLSLRGNQHHSITNEGLKHLSRLKKLTTLKLINCMKITDEGLQQLTQLNLTILDLTGCRRIGNVGLQYLSQLHNLTHLDLTGCHKIGNAGLQYLSQLHNLSYLNLTFCYQITDNGFQFLSQLYNLTTLNLSACSITDAGVLFLSQLYNLTTLNLSSCLITDIGLHHLIHLYRLSNLNLFNCQQITDGGINDLKETLPNLNIER